MAKSARASVRKRNNAKLRSTVFGPAADARTARLSARLQELVSLPKPDRKSETSSMDTDDAEQPTEANKADSAEEDMDVDVPASKSTVESASRKKKPSRIEKKKINRNRKAKNSITFKSLDKKAARQKRK